MARVPRRPHPGEGRAARPLHPPVDARRGPQEERRPPGPDHDALHQHHRRRRRALLPRRRGHRARLPPLAALERRRHGHPCPAPRRGRGRAHLLLRLHRHPLRGRLQPLLPRQGPPRRRRPRLLPGPRLAGQLRPRLPRGPPERGRPGRLPPGVLPPRRDRRARPALLPAPAPHGGLLGVPHRLHGPGPGRGHLPGLVRQVPRRRRHQGHLRPAHLGVPGRRRDGRARVARHAPAGRQPAAGQPHLRHQLQPAAPGRAGARQRQDHPGARGLLQGRGLERHQGDLGPRLGPAAGRGQGPRPGAPHDGDARRRLPDLQGQRRRLRARALLRTRPAHRRAGQGLDRRRDLGAPARRQ